MRKYHSSILSYILMVSWMFWTALSVNAETVDVQTPGTLSTLLSSSTTEVTIKGSINGSDVKYLRQLINEENLTALDLSETNFVSGGDAYYENYTTIDGVMSDFMFAECANLKSIILPNTIKQINQRVCTKTGLTTIVIPDNITTVGMDAFSYCYDMTSATIGEKVTYLGQGVFYQSKLKDVYVKPLTPPSINSYEFSYNPSFHVYQSALTDYQSSDWKDFGTFVEDLNETYPYVPNPEEIVQIKFLNYFEDFACTVLKSEFANKSDEELSTLMKSDSLSIPLINIALKVKNNLWNPYEKDFRIHSYNPYSDANYWHKKLKCQDGSYMGNPTGIYSASNDTIYLFVDQDVPSDATLYFAGCTDNNLISSAKSGTKLKKGLNIIEGEENAIYYILYTVNTSSLTKKVSEWPDMKIHIQGGVVNGYYDVARHSDTDYQALLENATYSKFTIKGKYTAMHFNTETYRNTWKTTIDKSVDRFDSLVVWEKDLMGISESVANGSRDYPPYHLSGGDAFFPSYYNNINWAMEGDESYSGYANASTYRTAYNSPSCIDASFNVDNDNLDEWCVAHEVGHTNQEVINLEGCTEVSNNLFSNVVCFLDGRRMTSGSPLSVTMDDYVNHVPFVQRDVPSMMRMYYQLYLYYHQAQHNTAFYPTLFKELREDPLELWNNTNESLMKFVRKVCEVAYEDLTDFFKAWGFFEPIDTTLDDYGYHSITVSQADIDATLAEIASYPTKNREILFIEDRIDYLETTDFLTSEGLNRLDADDKVGTCGDVGQFTDFISQTSEEPSYVYSQSGSFIGMEGTGGVGFIVLDENGDLLYASNNKSFELPSEVMKQKFTIEIMDANGDVYNVPKVDDGSVSVTLSEPGTLCDYLSSHTLHATISGPLNGTDINCLRQKINEEVLCSLDLSNATFVSGGEMYYNQYQTSDGVMSDFMFADCAKLKSIVLPTTVSQIKQRVCTSSGLSNVVIPDNITFLGMDAFSYCYNLTTATIGEKVTNMGQGVFYQSKIKDVYVKPLTPPTIGDYEFSSEPFIHVYKDAYEEYIASDWAKFGTIVGDLDEIENGENVMVKDFHETEIVVEKLIRDNQIIIIRNGVEYDVLGHRIKQKINNK